jgi:hypothetical protein
MLIHKKRIKRVASKIMKKLEQLPYRSRTRPGLSEIKHFGKPFVFVDIYMPPNATYIISILLHSKEGVYIYIYHNLRKFGYIEKHI